MNWFQRLLQGRSGVDQLSFAILILSIVVLGLATLVDIPLISIAAFALLVLCYLRIFSKNLAKRRAENERFLKLWSPVGGWFRTQKNKFRDRKTHRYFTCPSCRQSLRVPKGKGKISITCPKCKTEFVKET